MDNFFIMPPEETDLKIDLNEYSKQLKNRWPDIEISSEDDPNAYYILHWRIRSENYDMDGSLNRTLQVIRLHGDFSALAEFAIWYRSLIPLDYKLIFYDDLYYFHVYLEKGTTTDELIQNYKAE